MVLTLRGFAQASSRGKISKKIGIVFGNFFWIFFLLIKKLEIEKSKTTINISVLKVEIIKVVLVYSISNFFTNKNLRGKNNFCQKIYLFLSAISKVFGRFDNFHDFLIIA